MGAAVECGTRLWVVWSRLTALESRSLSQTSHQASAPDMSGNRKTGSLLAYLPTELYEAILEQIDPTELQRSTYALRLALPRSPIPSHQLFKHVRISSRNQIPKLWHSLELSRKADGDERAAAHWIQSLNLETFDVDADILNKYALSYLLLAVCNLYLVTT